MSHNYFKGICLAFYFAFNEHMNYITWKKHAFNSQWKRSNGIVPFSEWGIVFEIGNP